MSECAGVPALTLYVRQILNSTQSALGKIGVLSSLAKEDLKPPASGPITFGPVVKWGSLGNSGNLPGLALLSAKRTS